MNSIQNEILWYPSENRIKTSKMFSFMKNINAKYEKLIKL